MSADPMERTCSHGKYPEEGCEPCSTDLIDCPGCNKPFPATELERFYDRHGIYSGRACSDRCARVLPGQGDMWGYEAEEPIEEPE